MGIFEVTSIPDKFNLTELFEAGNKSSFQEWFRPDKTQSLEL